LALHSSKKGVRSTTNGDYAATFHLKRPQPSFLAPLATGWSPIYPSDDTKNAPARNLRKSLFRHAK
jgi:ABC-type transport system substrate-binding protein